MNKIILELPDNHLLICHPTGIFYTAQVGGHACFHPEEEGFVVPVMGGSENDSDLDCKLLCWFELWGSIEEMELCDRRDNINQKEMAVGRIPELNKILDRYWFCLNDNRVIEGRLRIDEDRIHRLTEGWWPVEFMVNQKVFKGIFHISSCD